MKTRNKIFIAAGAVAGLLLLSKKSSGAMKSYLGRNDLPRGIRNNNPGNLIITGADWVGKIPVSLNTDGHFEQFSFIQYGLRAMIKDLQHDILTGATTLESLIYQYAPPNENNTEAYINNIVNETGISRYSPLDTGRNTLQKLCLAFSKIENGGNYISASDFNTAWNLL